MTSTKSPEEIEMDRINQGGSRIGIHLRSTLLTCIAARPPPQKLTFWTLLRSPFTTIYRILAFITSFLPFISRFILPTTPTRRQLNPQDTASRFIREFEERYGREHVPFEDRGYAEVTQQVKVNLQFLLVILVSEEHDDTAGFCRDVLCDVELLNWVRVNECVVWAGNVADSEAHTGTTPTSPVSLVPCWYEVNGSVKFFKLHEISLRGINRKYPLPHTVVALPDDSLDPNRRTPISHSSHQRTHHLRYKSTPRFKSTKSIIKRAKQCQRITKNARRSIYKLPCRRPRKRTS